MSDTLRVYVLTAEKVEGHPPSFLALQTADDFFIAREVTKRYEMQPDGEPHEWAAYNEEDVQEEMRRAAEASE